MTQNKQLSAKVRAVAIRHLIRLIRVAADGMAFLLGPLLAAVCLYVVTGGVSVYVLVADVGAFVLTYMVLGAATLLWFWAWRGHYTYRKPIWSVARDVCMALLVGALGQLVIMAFLKWPISRYFWVLSWGFIFLSLVLERLAIKAALLKLKLWQKQCVIIGTGSNAAEAYGALVSDRGMGFDVQYFQCPLGTRPSPVEGVPVLHRPEQLWELTDPDDTQYVIAMEYGEEDLRDDWLREMAVRGCRAVSVIPSIRGVPLNSTDVSFIFSHDLMILQIRENLQKRWSRIIKRAFDVAGAAALLVVLSPLLAVLWWKIRQDGGEPIYGHRRIGQGGRPFLCLKFRSMVPQADQVLADLLARDPEARAEWEASFKLKNDPRITPLGRFLRRTSLDELPQLWNVLRGEMSLVGPRPVVEEELAFYGKNVAYYLMAKPGITGLWQVSGRSDVDYDTRVYFDAWYARNWSLWHDLVILVKTVAVVFRRDGAY